MMEKVRVAIVGSGPAGLSAAARAAARGMSHVMLEGAPRIADTIQRYQKAKHIMATPAQLQLRSDFAFEAGKKEDILGLWTASVGGQQIEMLLDASVKRISGRAGDFVLEMAGGRTVSAETVVLAIGTQSNPNLVRCPVGAGAIVQYSLDDPGAYLDEHITVIGGGDAGIENALGLVADPALGNIVTLLHRGADFPTAKAANVKALLAAESEGRLAVLREASALAIDKGEIRISARDGEIARRCDRVIARMGSAPPRAFVEGCGAEWTTGADGKPAIVAGTGVRFTSPDRASYPALSATYETSVPGLYVIGALAGYPLIKHCMNQGYDVIEYIAGNTGLKGADEPILEERLSGLPGGRGVADWLDILRATVPILHDVSIPQMRELMIDSRMRVARPGEVIFERNTPGSSVFAVVEGAVAISPVSRGEGAIGKGAIFGEVGLISGRPRVSTVEAVEPTILLEVPRMAALKLSAQVPAVARALDRISIERQLLHTFRSDITRADLEPLLETAEVVSAKAGEAVLTEGTGGYEIYVVRSGSMTVEKQIGGRTVFLSYLPAGEMFGEMAPIDHMPRSATVRAAIRSELIKLDGAKFVQLLDQRPALANKLREQTEQRQKINAYVEASKGSFSSAVDLHSSVADFLVKSGVGDATDVLLIDESLCIGCDNCERACADSHDGISRLDREAGRTYAHIHVPTSCRHCELPSCMADCPPNAIKRGPDGEVVIDDTCIGCGNCVRNCPYDVIKLDHKPPKKPGLLQWLLFGRGPGPGEPGADWIHRHQDAQAASTPSKAIKCDMCTGIKGGPACVRACPTGAAIRVAPEQVLSVARLKDEIS